MTATLHDSEVERYVADVAAHLGALPEGERTELLDDLRQHLVEVAAEDDGSLVARLGPPAAYAADLLASAGLVPDGRTSVGDQLRRIWHQVQASTPYRATADVGPDLRPAWWVLRGIGLVFAVNVLLVNDYERDWPWPQTGPVARVFVLVPIWLAIVASVAIGRSGRRTRAITLANAAIVVALVWAGTVMHDSRPAYRAPTTIVNQGFFAPDGRRITNIYPYGPDGPLQGVRLYDQDGQPIEVEDRPADQTQVGPATYPFGPPAISPAG